MTTYLSDLRRSGTHEWCHLTADSEAELVRMARRLRAQVKWDGRGAHVDLDVRRRDLAVRYGAVTAGAVRHP